MKIRFLRAAASRGCTALVNSLRDRGHDVKKLLISGSRYRGYPSHLIINWGSSCYRNIRPTHTIINKPEAVSLASNKLETFRKLSEAGLSYATPKWTPSKERAKEYIEDEMETVYCRTLARGSQGRGIVIASTVDELVDASLYTCKVDVERELRIHVFRNSIIDFAQKKRMRSERLETEGIEEVNEEVRNHSNGWVFARDGVQINDDIKAVSTATIGALGLDFGAVDLAVTPRGQVKVYEVNTAPGLEGTTLERYTEAILSLA